MKENYQYVLPEGTEYFSTLHCHKLLVAYAARAGVHRHEFFSCTYQGPRAIFTHKTQKCFVCFRKKCFGDQVRWLHKTLFCIFLAVSVVWKETRKCFLRLVQNCSQRPLLHSRKKLEVTQNDFCLHQLYFMIWLNMFIVCLFIIHFLWQVNN